MKEGIHPEYIETTITCACGNVIKTGSTRKSLRVEICSSCHPFFTGTRFSSQAAGRIEKFKTKYAKKK